MLERLKKSPLFAGMSDSDITNCLECSNAKIVPYEKDQIIFLQHELPEKLYVLLDGSIAVCSDSVLGKRNIVAAFTQPGELFGEVFLFIEKNEYDNYAQAAEGATVLEMPKRFLYQSCANNCGYHTKLISNMLSILAQKAYYLNKKLQIVSGSSLRQKIARALYQNSSADGSVKLGMNREELADYLNVARPSLSRELMKMQDDGLIKVSGKRIVILDNDGIKGIL